MAISRTNEAKALTNEPVSTAEIPRSTEDISAGKVDQTQAEASQRTKAGAPQSGHTLGMVRRLVLGVLALSVIGFAITAIVAGIVDGQGATAARERFERAQDAACESLGQEADNRVAAFGAGALGIAWAQKQLNAWPTATVGDCSETRDFIEEIASGEVDRRLAESKPTFTDSTGALTCDQRINSMLKLDIDEQSRRDNVDSIRIDCNMPPIQQDPFWQEAWRRHLEEAAGP